MRVIFVERSILLSIIPLFYAIELLDLEMAYKYMDSFDDHTDTQSERSQHKSVPNKRPPKPRAESPNARPIKKMKKKLHDADNQNVSMLTPTENDNEE